MGSGTTGVVSPEGSTPVSLSEPPGRGGKLSAPVGSGMGASGGIGELDESVIEVNKIDRLVIVSDKNAW